jgi:hypothetical protein
LRKTTLSDHDAVKRAAQYLLREGLATYAEIAAVSGRSRQIVRIWAIELDAETARQERLEKLWQRALRESK